MWSAARCGVLVLAFASAACGGSSDSAKDNGVAGGSGDLLLDETVGSFPHRIDMYVPKGATRAIVFLHGALGAKETFAYYVGVSGDRDTPTQDAANWDWLSEHKVIAVVPQGQHLPDVPRQTTWSNYVMDSGQDDVAFLRALAQELRERFGVKQVSLIGHSNGGMMTNRMWCESPDTFDAFIALSGPASCAFSSPGKNVNRRSSNPTSAWSVSSMTSSV